MILRLIKLKKIHGELDNLSEQENFFISLFNNLIEVREDGDIKYFSKDKEFIYFTYNPSRKSFWVAPVNVFSRIQCRYNISKEETWALASRVVKDILKMNIKKWD